MADDPIDLRSVNWSQGMFLTPDHFLRQERYVDSMLLWMARYAFDAAGVVGGGPRVEPAERGAAKFDPIVEVDETADALRITISQCRGITRGGAVVDIDPSRPVSATIAKRDLEGVLEIGVYVVARPHVKEPDAGVPDPVNPNLEAGRRFAYKIKPALQADEADWGLLLARLRRAERGLTFERTPGFIPPCALMSSHSALMDAFRQLNELVTSIADRYGLLHRAMVDYLALARTRHLPVDSDMETLEFVSRMVLTLEQGAYATLDPLQSPRQFFQEMNRLVRSAALFLSLSPPTRAYFKELGEFGEVEFTSLLEQEGETLETGRRFTIHEDLSVEVRRARRALERLSRLEQALEGRYLDFRLSPSLESLNFVFDRTSGDAVLYRSVSKPSRPQALGQELTFVFANLNIESRDARVILIGDREGRFMPGDQLKVEIRINRGEGYQHPQQFRTAEYEVEGQRNFAIDFSSPGDVATIKDVRVTIRSGPSIRSAMLYVRERLMRGTSPLPSFGSGAVTERVPPPVDKRPPRIDPAADQGRRPRIYDDASDDVRLPPSPRKQRLE